MGSKKKCRTCLGSHEVMFPLFDKIEELMETGFGTAIELLETFSFVPIRYKDDLPDHICANCLNEMQRAYSFKLKYEKSEMLLNQLKEVKVNLKKLKEIPNRHEFESESNCKLSTVKEEPEEISNLYDSDDSIKSELELNRALPDLHMTFKNEPELKEEPEEISNLYDSDDSIIKDNEIKSELEFNRKLPDLHMTFKNEPELNIEDVKGDDNEEFDCSQFEKPLSTERHCEHCSQYFTSLEMARSHACPRILLNRTNYNEEYEHTEQKTNQNYGEIKKSKKLTNFKSKNQCSVCSKVFSHKNNLFYHMSIHTGENPFKCNFCSEQFRRRPALRVHMEMKHINELPEGKPKFQCNVCFKIFTDNNHLVQHKRVHSGEKLFQCKLCSKKFRYKPSMVRHNLMMHAEELANEKPKYLCCVCSESFRIESDLVTHMRSHPNEKLKLPIKDTNEKRTNELPDVKLTYQCNVCSKSFRYNSQLIRHMVSHKNDKPIQCKLCSENFRHRQLLRVHMETKHINELPNDKPIIKCNFCSQVFAYSWNLNRHMHRMAKLRCQICSEKFCNNRLLAIHMKTKHLGELPKAKSKNQCSICSNVFNSKYSLNIHMRTHTGEKPFQCKLCSKTFQYRHLVRVHMETKHINELPERKPKFQCNICSKIFGFNNSLVRHMQGHTGEKSFQCEVCAEKFRYQETLFRHLQIHYKETKGNELNYQCSVCSKTFTYKIMLDIHMRTKHA